MKLIKPSFEIIDDNDCNVLESIELASRTCYKSEDKITKGSAEELFNKLTSRQHNAMLEFGYKPIFLISRLDALELSTIQIQLEEDIDNFDYYTNSQLNITSRKTTKNFVISGSIRVYRDLIKNHSYLKVVRRIANTLACNYGSILINDVCDYSLRDIDVLHELSPYNLTTVEQSVHVYKTVKFICDRGVSHELVRHRIASFAQESTRYCNYSKGDHITFIIPPWLTIEEQILVSEEDETFISLPGIHILNEQRELVGLPDNSASNLWIVNMIMSEIHYNHLTDYKWSPQQARSVLPNSLKTEINVSANLREWRHIFKQRVATGAHPQMRELMCPLLDAFKRDIPIIFDDINY